MCVHRLTYVVEVETTERLGTTMKRVDVLVAGAVGREYATMRMERIDEDCVMGFSDVSARVPSPTQAAIAADAKPLAKPLTRIYEQSASEETNG